MTSDSTLPRRSFLHAVSVSSAALAATGLLDACASTASVSGAPRPPQPANTTWDMSWVDRLTSPYRVVFNVTQLSNAEMAMSQAALWLDGHAQAHGLSDADLNLVMVFRHDAVRAVLSEAMWTRLAASGARTDFRAGMARLASRGATFLACNMALMGQAHALVEKESISDADARTQVRAAVAPGVFVMPNGVFAVNRAQTAGCSYFQPG